MTFPYTPFPGDWNDIPAWFKRMIDGGYFEGFGGQTAAEDYGASPSATGAVNTKAINAALQSQGIVTLSAPGVYTLACSTAKQTADSNTYNVALFIPSNTRFVLGPGVTLKVASGVTNPVIIQNSDIVNGNSNIEVSGGTWDGNVSNSILSDSLHNGGTGSVCAILRWFQNITDLRVHDCTVTNPIFWADGFAAVNKFWIYNIDYVDNVANRTASNNFGGVNLTGAATNGFIGNISGNTLDDLVALLPDISGFTGYTNTMAGSGNESDIIIDGISSHVTDGVWHHLRIQDDTIFTASRITARNITGPYIDSAVVLSVTPSKTGSLTNILIDGVISNSFTDAPGHSTIEINGGSSDVVIRNVWRVIASTETPQSVINIASGQTHQKLLLEDFHVVDNTVAGATIVNHHLASIVTFLCLQNFWVQSTSGSSAAGVLYSLGNATLQRGLICNVETVRTAKLVALAASGNVSTSLQIQNYTGFQNKNPVVSTASAVTLPLLQISDWSLFGTRDTTNGEIAFVGLSGSCQIQASNIVTNNTVFLTRSSSESIRFQGISIPVNSSILTPARGDIILDSGNSNDPYRWSGAAWTAL